MRRRRKASDSLDLLLDTICNTFGGILFIALLVVILLQMQTDRSEATPLPAVSAAELQELRQKLTDQITDTQRLRDMLAQQRKTLAALAPPELATLVADHETVHQQHDELQRRREQLLQESAAAAEIIRQTEEQISSAASELETVQQQVASLQQQLDENRESRHHELRTPVLRTSPGKQEIGCVLQYGRFYVWHRYSRSGIRMGLNTDDFIVLDSDSEGAYTTPRPTAGIPVNQASRAQLLRRLSGFSPSNCHIAVIVRPDSFAEWPIVRDALSERGFEYRLMPTDEETRFIDQGGSDSRVQ